MLSEQNFKIARWHNGNAGATTTKNPILPNLTIPEHVYILSYIEVYEMEPASNSFQDGLEFVDDPFESVIEPSY
jgi:hypothetical protein